MLKRKEVRPMTEKVLSAGAQKIQDTLLAKGFQCRVMELEKSTRSAAEAAQAVGCHIAQIVKSLVFRGKTTQKAYLVVVSGANRVNEKKLSETVGETVKMADADFVRKTTGFVIGGVPPMGHTMLLETLIDTDLLKHEKIWAAAGTPNALFCLTSEELAAMTGGRVVSIT